MAIGGKSCGSRRWRIFLSRSGHRKEDFGAHGLNSDNTWLGLALSAKLPRRGHSGTSSYYLLLDASDGYVGPTQVPLTARPRRGGLADDAQGGALVRKFVARSPSGNGITYRTAGC